MPIKSFRGLIEDGGVQQIRLSTRDGSIGYKIKRFEAVGEQPGQEAYESTLQIFTVPQTSPGTAIATIDFSNQELLGVAVIAGSAQGFNVPYSQVVVFDNKTFNQDIYITHVNTVTTGVDTPANWHIELEQVKLDLNENTVATLKDIRNLS